MKKAKKQVPTETEEVLTYSLVRSLAREADKLYTSENPYLLQPLRRQLERAQKDKDRYRSEYRELEREIVEKFGRNWRKK